MTSKSTMETDNISPPSKKTHSFNQNLSFWLSILVVLLLIIIVRHYDHSKKIATPKQKAVSVVLAKAKISDVPVYLYALGNVTPTYNVTVQSQINGTLMQVYFREGQMVKKGEFLAQIDPRPYEAMLVEYEGQLVRDQALLGNARIDLVRYQNLWKQNSISEQTLATQKALVQQYIGTVQIDKGLIEVTKINLIYCRITAPVAGRIGLRLVDPGNYVQTSSPTGIAVINTLDPITVIFTLPEDNIPEILQKIYGGGSYPIKAYDRQQKKLLANGKLLTMDNQIDPSTGTVRLKGQFPNANNALFPSQFVNITLLLKTLKNAVVVPTAAIQYSSKNSFIYVVDSKQTVHMTPVVAGVTIADSSSITTGITSGQEVVIEGADNLTDGAKVTQARGAKSKKPAATKKTSNINLMIRRIFA